MEFSIVDANVNAWNFEETREEIKKTKADLILISALSIDYQLQYHKTAELAKQALPLCKVLFGGEYASVLPEQILHDTNIDYLMQGYRIQDEKIVRGIRDQIFQQMDFTPLYVGKIMKAVFCNTIERNEIYQEYFDNLRKML